VVLSCGYCWCSDEVLFFFFFSSRRRHTRLVSDWSSDVCSSDLPSRDDGQADIRTHLIRRPARDIIPPLVDIRFLLSALILYGCHVAATSLVHRNSVPSTQMRCMITANRRAKATIAFFSPRCRPIFIAQALSQNHSAEGTNGIWAAS